MESDFIYIIDKASHYPAAPFNPDKDYPEFGGLFKIFDQGNTVYPALRRLFLESGFDSENSGRPGWNPFRGYIKNGGTVVIKPNLVFDERAGQAGKGCLITHGSVIRPVTDYLFLLQKTDNISFRVIVCDVPIQGANFDKILEQSGLKELQEFYKNSLGFNMEIMDLRHKIAKVDGTGFYVSVNAKGDPLGYSSIHLENSFLEEIASDYRKFGAPGYGLTETYSQIETTGSHYYHIPNTVLSADLFINIPKLKTHKKAGITIALKNLIGINGEKAWIPHYRRGSVKNGGDEFDENQVFLKTLTTKSVLLLQGKSKFLWKCARFINRVLFKKIFRKYLNPSDELSSYEKKALFLVDGNWYGNDTLWRAILDLNYLLFNYDSEGKKSATRPRNYICISDGIIAGEGDGPLDAQPKNSGLLTLSENPVINDLCLAKIMGFDWEKIPVLKNSVMLKNQFRFDGTTDMLKILQCNDGDEKLYIKYSDLPSFGFLPPPGWLGHI
jgi:uncharacterized protein (DUF362 family)